MTFARIWYFGLSVVSLTLVMVAFAIAEYSRADAVRYDIFVDEWFALTMDERTEICNAPVTQRYAKAVAFGMTANNEIRSAVEKRCF